mmetsp:Transcript_88095/g.140089  ORF Transcript_88095/g.140089 Transcript_88095/m.140089 type:complete len:218 (-) Transcript_88095:46-699(-)
MAISHQPAGRQMWYRIHIVGDPKVRDVDHLGLECLHPGFVANTRLPKSVDFLHRVVLGQLIGSQHCHGATQRVAGNSQWARLTFELLQRFNGLRLQALPRFVESSVNFALWARTEGALMADVKISQEVVHQALGATKDNRTVIGTISQNQAPCVKGVGIPGDLNLGNLRQHLTCQTTSHLLELGLWHQSQLMKPNVLLCGLFIIHKAVPQLRKSSQP